MNRFNLEFNGELLPDRDPEQVKHEVEDPDQQARQGHFPVAASHYGVNVVDANDVQVLHAIQSIAGESLHQLA